MTFDELKSTLLSASEEGADTASIYESVLSDAAGVYSERDNLKQTVDDLTARIANLSETNTKLLDKIRYTEAEAEVEDKEPEAEVITIDNLFEEE